MNGTRSSLRIAFLHPDLGLGGSARLVVDAATELGRRGHRVTIYTAAHDPARGFTGSGAAGVDILVRGAALPASVGQRLRAPAAILRMAWLTAALARGPSFDIVVCDQVPHAIPLLRRLVRAPVVYYGHHPDLLLTPPRHGWYALYRVPLDRLEAAALKRIDLLLVNSRFTARSFGQSFPALSSDALRIVHPGVVLPPDSARDPDDERLVLLAFGRLAPEKNLELAVASVGALRARLAPDVFAKVRLVIAGSYDPRQRESRQVLRRLDEITRQHGLGTQVEIRRSVSERERRDLLALCRCVVHPHPAEHFGIVPVEAMAAGRPVVAVNRGGPLETVVDGETGYLRAPEPDAFAEALARVLTDPGNAQRMGRAGRARVRARFSREAMGERLETLFQELVSHGDRRSAAPPRRE